MNAYNALASLGVEEVAPSFQGTAFGVHCDPNPFYAASGVAIRITGSCVGSSGVRIFDLSGGLVRVLAPGGTVKWDGRDDNGVGLPSGVYFAGLAWKGEVFSERLVMTR